jgi:RNA polymerase sigma-70 factor, ECF subfamily
MISPSQDIDSQITQKLQAALAGDQAAFSLLVEPHRSELLTHCYRMLGSLQDAEDQVQETLLRAWRRLDTYAGRASFRAWLYKIATNACLDALKRRPRRCLPPDLRPASPPTEVQPPVNDPIWLEPFPDELLAPQDSGPEARYEALEGITLAFLSALQRLPPRQRSVLIFCDVLDWPADEVAGLLDTTPSAVNSMLYRARRSLAQHYSGRQEQDDQPILLDEETTRLLRRYVDAWEMADIETLVALLREDASFPMPPRPLWYYGRPDIRALITGVILAGEAVGRWHLLPARANGRQAFGLYVLNETRDGYTAYAIQVLTFQDGLLADVTTFGFPELFPFFGLDQEIALTTDYHNR